MFDSFATAKVIGWMNEGQALQQRNEAFRSQVLSFEHLLVAGFCSLELQRGQDIFLSYSEAFQEKVSSWVDQILMTDFSTDVNQTLGNFAYSALIPDPREDEGLSPYHQIILPQQRVSVAKIRENATQALPRFILNLWDDVEIRGSKFLVEALVEGVSYPLLRHYDATQSLISVLALGIANERGSVGAPTRDKIWIPPEACALIDVGLQGSMRLLWAETWIAKAVGNESCQSVFTRLKGAFPGRYAYYLATTEQPVTDVDGGHYVLQFNDQLVEEAKSVEPGDWIKWKAKAEAAPLSFALSQEEYVDVRLASGNILKSCMPDSLDWHLKGLGTITDYRPVQYPCAGTDMHLLMAYDQNLAELQNQNPFLKTVEEGSGQNGWSLSIVDTREDLVLVNAFGFSRHDLYCQGLQQILWRLAD